SAKEGRGAEGSVVAGGAITIGRITDSPLGVSGRRLGLRWARSARERATVTEENLRKMARLGEAPQAGAVLITRNGRRVSGRHWTNFGITAPTGKATTTVGRIRC